MKKRKRRSRQGKRKSGNGTMRKRFISRAGARKNGEVVRKSGTRSHLGRAGVSGNGKAKQEMGTRIPRSRNGKSRAGDKVKRRLMTIVLTRAK